MLEPSRARIAAVLRQPKITKALLAEYAGVHVNSLRDIESPDWNPLVKTLEAIMVAVGKFEAIADSEKPGD